MIFSIPIILSAMKGFLVGALGFVLKYWKQIIIIGMISIIFHQNFMRFEVAKWVGLRTIPGIVAEYEEQIQIISEQLVECEASRRELKAQIASTNQQIDKWAEVSKGLQKEQDQLVVELRKMQQKSQQEVQDILAGPTPEGCSAAIQYLRDAKEDLKWKRSSSQ